MHSRIFQVSEKPIEKSDYIVESNYWDHWFLNSHADYVADSDRDEDIEWLSSYGDKGIFFDKDEHGEFLIVTDKISYFARKYERFKAELEKVNAMSLEQFSKDWSSLWSLKDAYEEKYGFYIDENDDLMSLDSFVRTCRTDVKYYIGGTVDYHC